MKKLFYALAGILLLQTSAHAQSKVFKEVSSEISSRMKPILQDGTLVGYLMATQLEKVNADSFNYKVTIMDENLNDIGEVNFKERWLKLQDVCLEGDVLCLAYVKSDFFGREFKKNKDRRAAMIEGNVYVFTQFMNLEGKILKTQTVRAEVTIPGYTYTSVPRTAEGLKYQLRMRNIPGKGFVCFYGDERKNTLLAYDTNGEQLWQKTVVDDDAEGFTLLTTEGEVYLLKKGKSAYMEGGYVLMSYNSQTGKNFPPYYLSDKEGLEMKVIGFDIDPLSGRPYITGNLIHGKKGTRLPTIRRFTHGLYTGVFTLKVEEPGRKGIQPVYSYWEKDPKAQFNKKGKNMKTNAYPVITNSFRDYSGNTVFSGLAMQRKPRYVALGLSLATAPLLVGPIYVIGMGGGTHKYKSTEAVILRQSDAGELNMETCIPGSKQLLFPTIFVRHANSVSNGKTQYIVSNPDTKSNYVIVSDSKKTSIYDVQNKKVIREISRKEGKVTTDIYPAKEGHVLVSEYDAKEKETRISIEAVS